MTTMTTPTMNSEAMTVIVVLRPILSEIRPPVRAPTALANSSELTAMPRPKLLRSSWSGRTKKLWAPLMTLVS